MQASINSRNVSSTITFWFLWLAATTIGVMVGGMLAIPIGWGLADPLEKSLGTAPSLLVVAIAWGVLWGGGIGLAQMLVLWRRLDQPFRWTLYSIAGATVAFTLVLGTLAIFALDAFDSASDVVSGTLIGLTMGIGLGVGQWLLLREFSPRALWWIAISVIAAVVAFGVALSVGSEGRELLSLAIGGLIMGGLGGVGLLWVLRE